MDLLPLIAMAVVFFGLMALSLPISFSMGLATLVTLALMFPLDQALFITAQKMSGGLDSFTLLAIPFFILAGNIMSSGGIARRLIDLARTIGAGLPGSLAHVTILANMMFGAISGSAVASAAAVGGVMTKPMKDEGYAPSFAAAVNISSCTTGLLIPPSTTFIVYSLISGGTSVAALFLAGYGPGIMLGLGLMSVAGVIAWRRGYPVTPRPSFAESVRATRDALLPLGLIVVIMGGIIGGVFTATEASAVAVVYALILALFVYREITWRDLGPVLVKSAATTSIVLFLIGVSIAMSWAMTYADMPWMISEALKSVSENPIILLLFINLCLLVIGAFMDMTPALLIFTPIFLPVAQELGMDPVHFGVMMTLNLCIGICTPPVGSALFVGCSIAEVPIWSVLKPLLPFYAIFVLTLAAVTFLPGITLTIPRLVLGYGG